MTEYNKVIDKYWIEFLEYVHKAVKNEYVYSKVTKGYFWAWYYQTLCEKSPTLAKQKWDEAQG